MIDWGAGLIRSRKNDIADITWRILVSFCVAFSLMKVYYFFNSKILSEIPLEVFATQHTSENPLTVIERMLEHEGVCDAMHVFLTAESKVEELKLPEESECDCESFQSNKEEKVIEKMTEANLLKTLVIDLMLVFLLFLGLTALLDVLKERKKEVADDPDSRFSRRCSLAEYANMKHSRKSSMAPGKDHGIGFTRKESGRTKLGQLTRYESLGSAYTRLRRESLLTGIQNYVTGNETPNTPPTAVARAPLKLLAARPPPLIRRSSFPASILLEVANQQNRRGSVDSEDDSSTETSRRRTRLIRRH